MRNTFDMQKKKIKNRNRRNNFYSILAFMKLLEGIWGERVRTYIYITIFVVATKAVISKDIKVE